MATSTATFSLGDQYVSRPAQHSHQRVKDCRGGRAGIAGHQARLRHSSAPGQRLAAFIIPDSGSLPAINAMPSPIRAFVGQSEDDARPVSHSTTSVRWLALYTPRGSL